MEFANATADELNGIDSNNSNPIPVIYQSGYLTIKDYDKEYEEYTLGFPNEEVEKGFIKFLAPFYLSKSSSKSSFDIRAFVKDIESGNAEQFCKRMKSLFADTPYELIKDLENHYQNIVFFADTPYELVKDLENHYQNIVWVLFKLLGFYTQAEYHTSNGRIDLLIKTRSYTYVMEFKLDGTAEDALQQIREKDYPLPFSMDNKTIFLIGINFSNDTRNIEKYVIETKG